ncbi:D-alanyl-D-alanine carboxypeptidase family protein [Aurantiacibacter sediminis]|uniref:serine-type D-Ala-D-Ala carboxypeptidase n=1 Tax=Aurantiacibacter sediminis TaxID=2793064 RepID=A0ABS0N3Q0_9SPHN|nr:D-alanyl-D-alanine carboxypeptidase family protein [Aurantiacibacter sediminis]MBH5322603.1 D-alanyl-D-alanine carboxypeptidase [Aurantiacibacter sediminis]
MDLKRFTAVVVGLGAFVLPASPAMPAPAPVPEDIPVGLLVDLSTGQTLFSREADRRFVPASVTKVMTAYTAFKLIDEDELRLDMQYLYPASLEEEWYAEGSNMFLRAGERPTVAQLLLGITTVSGNDASVALANAATGSLESWIDLMNANAEALGMRDTHFGSTNGFPDGGQTYTTASDLALLGAAITRDYPGLYRRFFGHRGMRWRDIAQSNHDPVTGRVDGADGMKTGYTNEAGFTFLGSAERDDRRLLMVLAGAPSGRERDVASRALLEWGFDNFEHTTLIDAGAIVGSAEVQDGSAARVNLRLERDLAVALPKDIDVDSWKLETVYRGPLVAPIAAGDTVARLRLTIDGENVLEAPLIAAADVQEANMFERIANAFSSWMN